MTAHVVPISAQSDAALRELAGRYARFLEQAPQVALCDFATTLKTGRARLNHRAALVARSVEELAGQLREFSEHRVSADISHGALRPGEQPRIAFLFTGQGAQYPGMGRRLYETEPVFRQVLESLFIERMELNEELFTDYMAKPEMQALVSKWLGGQVYDRLSAARRRVS